MIKCNICEYNIIQIYALGYYLKNLILLIVYCIYFNFILKYDIYIIKMNSKHILLHML